MKYFLIIALFLPLFIQAQHPNVSLSSSGYPDEPSIVINPKNTNQMVAGSNIDFYYYSEDAGQSWQEGIISSTYGVWGDPCIIADTSGTFYFFHLSYPPAGNWIDRIVCQKMIFPGPQWNDGSFMGLNGTKAQDKEWAIVNPYNNHIYCTWTQFDDYSSSNPLDSSIIRFSKSTDGGQSWSPAVRINKVAGDCIDSDNTVEGAVPAVGPNGEIYVSWMGPDGLRFDKSLDEGQTWLDNDILVSDIPGGWDFNIPGISRCDGFPVTTCDLSNGPYHGTIYINWSDQRNGPSDTDIWLSKSTDGGATWSTPVRVNDDPPGNQQFLTWMAVDQVTGYLWFVFYDRRNYLTTSTDVYMARSTDGGQSFVNFKVNEELACSPQTLTFIGDYTNISAHNNVIRPVWTQHYSNSIKIKTALINPDLVGINTPPAEQETKVEVYPNPAKDILYFLYKIRNESFCSLKITDNQGRDIHTFFENQQKSYGKHLESLDISKLNLTSGTYYLILLTNDKVYKRQAFIIN